MRRVVLAVVATATGLVRLLPFKSHTLVPPTAAAAVSGSTSGSGAGSSGSSAQSGKTVKGKAVETRYGTVQVSVTLSGTKITKVTPLQLPQREQRSVEIANGAVPVLAQEALSAQNAQIDAVSGATYTSQGYI